MAAQAAHLEVVRPTFAPANRETGEALPLSIENLTLDAQNARDELAELMRAFRKQSRELAELKRDKQAEAEVHRCWPVAERVFLYHGRLCGFEGSEWGWEQFELIVPKLKGSRLPGKRSEKEALGLERCLRAIAGAHFDPYRKRRRNGTFYVHNTWNAIFGRVPGKASAFEDFIARCPTDWRPPVGAMEILGPRGVA